MVNRSGGFTFQRGTSMNAMTRYAAYPGEEGKVVLQPPGGNFVMLFGGTSYVEVSGLVLDASKTEGGAVVITREKDHHNRLLRNEIRNGREGISGGGEHEIIGNRIHHMRGYGIYTGGDNGLVEGNIFYENGGYAIHLFQQSQEPSNWVIRNNIFFDNGRGYIKRGSGQRTAPAVLISRGRNNQVYNNLVYHNHAGIFVGYGAADTLMAHNTVYGNDDYGILVSSEHSGSRNTRVINNIVWGHRGEQILNTGTNTTLQANFTSEPGVVNADGGDFHLRDGSPAIGTGVPLRDVPVDMAGGARPAGSSCDAGAFQFTAAPHDNQPRPAPVP
ncbi:MAG TPA: right-handed parallel beta-helix repeat-containing protein [Nitrospira sp.]|nr:right-handed parallel beta-helix repeat-containing protein [Nitrospira sp.]